MKALRWLSFSFIVLGSVILGLVFRSYTLRAVVSSAQVLICVMCQFFFAVASTRLRSSAARNYINVHATERTALHIVWCDIKNGQSTVIQMQLRSACYPSKIQFIHVHSTNLSTGAQCTMSTFTQSIVSLIRNIILLNEYAWLRPHEYVSNGEPKFCLLFNLLCSCDY